MTLLQASLRYVYVSVSVRVSLQISSNQQRLADEAMQKANASVAMDIFGDIFG